MPAPSAYDPLRTTDHAPAPEPEVPAPEIGEASSSPAGKTTVTHHPKGVAESQDGSATAPAEPEPPSIPGYEIEGVLGRGGMGVVYKARHLALKRTVALKMIRAGHAGSQDLARFRVEAEAVARLQHPNIVQIHEVGAAEGHPYCALEFVAGGSLAQRLLGRPLPARESARLVEALALAMQLAHSRNVVHRDLKPANVLLAADSTPKVTDFGLARQTDSDSGETQAGTVMGTPSYMAPEQASGRAHEAGPAADVYALGAILYACLTGRPPFQGKTVVETLDQVRTQEPAPPSRWRSGVPLDLETICLKCLRKEPERRYSSARALAEDLRRWQAGEPIAARPVGTWERCWKWTKRRPAVAALSAAVFMVLVAGIGGVTWQWQEAVAQKNNAEVQTGLAQGQTLIAEGETEKAKKAETEAKKSALEEAKAKVEAQNETRRAEDQTLRANTAFYASQLDLTRRQLRDGDYVEAQGRLDACRWDLRGWEHDYLQALLRRCAQTLYGHTNNVLKAVFSPDGRRVASASFDGTVRVWDLATGVETLVLRGHRGGVRDVAYHPDGKWLVSASLDGTLKLWDASNGRVLRTLQGHRGQVLGVAFSPDGGLIASASADGTIKLWDANTGKDRLTLQGHKEPVLSVAFSPDGLRLASSSMDKTAKVWDVKTGQEILTLMGHTDAVYAVAFRPDGKRLATGGGTEDSTVRMWDAENGKELFVLQARRGKLGNALFGGVAFSPEGRRLAAAGFFESAMMWDADNGKELLVIQPHTSQTLYSIAFSPDGQTLVCANYSGRGEVQLYDIGPMEESSPVQKGAALPVPVQSATLSADGQRVIKASEETQLAMYDSATGRKKQVWEGFQSGIGFSPVSSDLSRLAYVVLPERHTVQVHDLTREREVLTLKKAECKFGNLVFRSDGKRLATSSTTGDQQSSVAVLTVWDTDVGREVFTIQFNKVTLINPVVFSADGKRIAASCGSTPQSGDALPQVLLKVFDAETGRELHTLSAAGTGPVFSPDGRLLAAFLASTRTVKIWEVQSGKEMQVLTGGGGPLHFSKEGNHLFALGTGQAWEVETGKPLPHLRLPGSPVGRYHPRIGFNVTVHGVI